MERRPTPAGRPIEAPDDDAPRPRDVRGRHVPADEARTVKRRSFHRAVFVAAGAYNLAWGAVTALMPQWPLRVGGMEPMRYPEIMACLAMVVGVYGLLYLEVARRPENGVAIAAVGLLGKVLGPIGMAVMVVRGEWTLAAALAVTLTNDFAWWIPFGLYLRDATRRPEAA